MGVRIIPLNLPYKLIRMSNLEYFNLFSTGYERFLTFHYSNFVQAIN